MEITKKDFDAPFDFVIKGNDGKTSQENITYQFDIFGKSKVIFFWVVNKNESDMLLFPIRFINEDHVVIISTLFGITQRTTIPFSKIKKV
jgi:hypothetical protein